mgnify:CR=1 FL=1
MTEEEYNEWEQETLKYMPDFIIEDNSLKHNKFIPGVKIPIRDKKFKPNKKVPILVLAWNFFNEIKDSNSFLSDKFINIKDLEISNK